VITSQDKASGVQREPAPKANELAKSYTRLARASLGIYLAAEGFEVRTVATLARARAVILSRGSILTDNDIILPKLGGETEPGSGFFSITLKPDGSPPPIEAVEREYMARVLAHLGGRRMVAAQTLGVSYPTFLKRLRELDLE